MCKGPSLLFLPASCLWHAELATLLLAQAQWLHGPIPPAVHSFIANTVNHAVQQTDQLTPFRQLHGVVPPLADHHTSQQDLGWLLHMLTRVCCLVHDAVRDVSRVKDDAEWTTLTPAARQWANLVLKAIVGEGQAVLHLPVGEHLAQLLHQAGHSLPLLACLDATLQLAVGIPPLASHICTVRPSG